MGIDVTKQSPDARRALDVTGRNLRAAERRLAALRAAARLANDARLRRDRPAATGR